MPAISRVAATDLAGTRRRIGIVVFVLLLAAGAAFAMRRADVPPGSTLHRVVIERMAFTPAVLTVHAGDRVSFENRDLVPHTATAQQPDGFDSGTLASGKTWTYTFRQTGSVEYTCIFHPTMKATILVNPR